ncbi:MAG TPA: hypothetical protein VHG72_00380 [Polyangia bacterium]|nr:hypothetical protein [Polyangia bacterium]
MSRYGAAVLLSVLAGGSAAAATPAIGPKGTDYELAFAQAFPAAGGEHRISDWALYTSLVAGDLVTYARRIDPAVAKRADEAQGKPYQTQQVEVSVRGDLRLVAAFNDHRHRIQSMVVYVDGEGFTDAKCQHDLTYVEGEFRLVLGESGTGGDPLSHATIAPSCPFTLARGFQVTAGRSSRFKCWPTKYAVRCGLALPDMPVALKGVIESQYPASVALRWRWRGLGDVVRTRYVDANGNRVPAHGGVAVTVPDELSPEFVDAGGHVLWTAPAAAAAGSRR